MAFARCAASLAVCLLGVARALPAHAKAGEASVSQARLECTAGEGASAECPTRSVSRLLLIGAPQELASALRTALSPWGVSVRRLDSRRARSTLRRSAAPKNALARELGADALIWLEVDATGRRLGLYDATSDTTTTRHVPPGRLDDREAAALALSIKTALRGVPAEPPDTTLGHDAPPSAPAPVDVGARPSASPAEEPVEPALALARGAALQLVLGAGLRSGVLPLERAQLRYDAEVRWLPALLAGDVTALWLAARLDTGTPTSVTTSGFRGEYSQLGFGLGFGVTRRLHGVVDVGGQVAASLDHASLTGTLLSDSSAASQSRLGASLHLRPEVAFALGPLALLLQPALAATARAQRYRADGAAVLETGHISWRLGAGLRLNAL